MIRFVLNHLSLTPYPESLSWNESNLGLNETMFSILHTCFVFRLKSKVNNRLRKKSRIGLGICDEKKKKSVDYVLYIIYIYYRHFLFLSEKFAEITECFFDRVFCVRYNVVLLSWRKENWLLLPRCILILFLISFCCCTIIDLS